MWSSLRQLRIPLKVLALQRTGCISSHSIQVHPLQVRTFASTPRAQSTETSNIRETPLFQQLTANPAALLAIKEFGQFMKNHGRDLATDQPPSMIQLIKLMSNSDVRNAVKKLNDDLANAGVHVNPEDAMQMLKTLKASDLITK